MSTATLLVVIILLGVGTYALRLGGVLLAKRVPASSGGLVTRLLPYLAVALLAALATTAAVTDAGHFAGVARPAGVLAGLVAGLLKTPFAVAVILAAALTAALRLLGVP